MNSHFEEALKNLLGNAFNELQIGQKQFAIQIWELTADAHRSMETRKRDVIAFLGSNFPAEDWQPSEVSSMLNIIIIRAPIMIPVIISRGWLARSIKNRCLHVMAIQVANEKKYAKIITQLDVDDFRDIELTTKLIKHHPYLFKNLKAKDIPQDMHVHMLETMGIYMNPCLWELGINIIRERTASEQSVYGFFRAAVQVVKPIGIIKFIASVYTSSIPYDFLSDSMIHWMSPRLCEYFIDSNGSQLSLNTLAKIYALRSNPVFIVELFTRFIQQHKEWTSKVRSVATNLILCLRFQEIEKITGEQSLAHTSLRIMAKHEPGDLIRATSLFRRDKEVIHALLKQRGIGDLRSSLVDNIDIEFLLNMVPNCLEKIEGAWGVLMYLVDKCFRNRQVQANKLRNMLLAFLFCPKTKNRLYRHSDENFYLHFSNSYFLVARGSHVTTPLLQDVYPIQVHPMDLYALFRTAEYDMVSLLSTRTRDFMFTNGSEGPQMQRFFEMPPKYRQVLDFQIWNTMRMLAYIFENNELGIEIKVLVDTRQQSDNIIPICFTNNHTRPVLLLHADGDGVDWDGVNRLIGERLGISLLSIITSRKIIDINASGKWSWMGFMVQPAFRQFFPTFEQLGLQADPRNIVQVNRYIEGGPSCTRYSTCFNHWISYDVTDDTQGGPRLMLQTFRDPPAPLMVLNLFTHECMESGNQMLASWQEFGNARTILETVVHDQLSMEPLWVRVLTEAKHAANTRMPETEKKWFTSFANEIPDAKKQTNRYKAEMKDKTRMGPYPVMIADHDFKPKKDKSKWVFPTVWSKNSFDANIKKLPNDVLVIIYKHLVKGMLNETLVPIMREIIPDFWWSATKQNLYFTNHGEPWNDVSFYVESQIVGLTDPNGVLYPPYCKDVTYFLKAIWQNVYLHIDAPKATWEMSFDKWPTYCFKYIPKSKRIPLFGGLFVVQFDFIRPKDNAETFGYCLTIAPNRLVYRVHDVNEDPSEKRFAMCIQTDVEQLNESMF